MRLLYSTLLAALPLASATAGCTKDSTRAAPTTLFGRLPIAALHLDAAGGSAMVGGESRSIVSSRLAIAFCRWPSYSVAAVGGSHATYPTTDYIASGSQSYHPELYANWSAIELQKRWRDSSIVRPTISVAYGEMSTEYRYSHRLASGTWEDRQEGASSATYLASAVGVEVSLFKYMTSYLLVGARKVGALNTPGVGRGDFDGRYVTFGFGFGKFR